MAAINAKEGDIIQFRRLHYSHYAIYIDNEEIIHRTSDPNKDSPSSLTSFHEIKSFCAIIKVDRLVDVVGFPEEATIANDWDNIFPPFSPQDVVRRAKSKLGEKGYDLLHENCEHFVMWCRYGVNTSHQAEAVKNCLNAGTVAITPSLAINRLRYAGVEDKKKTDDSAKKSSTIPHDNSTERLPLVQQHLDTCDQRLFLRSPCRIGSVPVRIFNVSRRCSRPSHPGLPDFEDVCFSGPSYGSGGSAKNTSAFLNISRDFCRSMDQPVPENLGVVLGKEHAEEGKCGQKNADNSGRTTLLDKPCHVHPSPQQVDCDISCFIPFIAGRAPNTGTMPECPTKASTVCKSLSEDKCKFVPTILPVHGPVQVSPASHHEQQSNLLDRTTDFLSGVVSTTMSILESLASDVSSTFEQYSGNVCSAPSNRTFTWNASAAGSDASAAGNSTMLFNASAAKNTTMSFNTSAPPNCSGDFNSTRSN